MSNPPPTLYLFGGCNGAGKSTFARAYLRQLAPVPRFLNADELARGLSPLEPGKLAVRAGKLLLQEIDSCIKIRSSFGLESTLSGMSHVKLLQEAKSLGYQIEIHYLWLPSPDLAIRRIRQRVKKGGHHIPDEDVRRRFVRSRENFINRYAPIADSWLVWDNHFRSPTLLSNSDSATVSQLKELL